MPGPVRSILAGRIMARLHALGHPDIIRPGEFAAICGGLDLDQLVLLAQYATLSSNPDFISQWDEAKNAIKSKQ